MKIKGNSYTIPFVSQTKSLKNGIYSDVKRQKSHKHYINLGALYEMNIWKTCYIYFTLF